jgi:hypothetical protein
MERLFQTFSVMLYWQNLNKLIIYINLNGSLNIFTSFDCKAFLISAYFETQVYKGEYNEYHKSTDNVYQNNI